MNHCKQSIKYLWHFPRHDDDSNGPKARNGPLATARSVWLFRMYSNKTVLNMSSLLMQLCHDDMDLINIDTLL